MTDKDIKDYCKNCSVEPPAMRFKCPECEHNPDNENNFEKDINVPSKEQIILDGCNVSECLFYQSNFEEDYDVKIKHFCSNWHNSCESVNNSNCYFKQLARKTAECEELKKQLMQKSEVDMFFNTPIEGWSNDPCGICKFKNCLAEIKEITKNMNTECFYDDFDCKDCDMQNGCTYFNKKQIIQKISE